MNNIITKKNKSPGGNNSETKQWNYKITPFGRNVKLTTTGDNDTEWNCEWNEAKVGKG